jgi:hypothetical protein
MDWIHNITSLWIAEGLTVSFFTDIEAGREKYRKRNDRRAMAYSRSRTQRNSVVMELGGFIEFTLSKLGFIMKTDSRNTATAVQESRASPYMSVLRRDLKCFLDWICNKFPQKPKVYDPLQAAWERGKKGWN